MANQTKGVQVFVNESHWQNKGSIEVVECTYVYLAAEKVDFGVWSAVPPELIECWRWLPYREFSGRIQPYSRFFPDGKLCKNKYGSTVKASVPVAETQGLSFRSAKTLCDADEKYDGLGIVTGDGYNAIRLHGHGCNGSISEEAQRILKDIDSYAELSGNDISIFYRGESRDERLRDTSHPDITFHKDNEFIPVTGRHISEASRSLNKRRVTLESVIQATYGDAVDGSGHEDQVAETTTDVGGNKHDHIEDDSEIFELPDWGSEQEAEEEQHCENGVNESPKYDDVKVYQAIRRDAVAWSYWSDAKVTGNRRRAKTFALLKKLAFYCSHCRAQMDRLFRRSKLMHSEWDKVENSLQTYGARMMKEACEATDGNWVPRPQRTGNPIGRIKTPRTRAVEAALAADPKATLTEIARQTGRTTQYVWNVKNGYRPGKGKAVSGRKGG
jgi:hypothetical protein